MIYAINKRTKEHRVVPDGVKKHGADWRIVESDSYGWIPWNSEKLPLPDGSRMDIRTRNGNTYLNFEQPAGGFTTSGHPLDINAYRPIAD